MLRQVLAILCAAAFVALASATPLDDYVNRPDPTYKYELLQSTKLTDYTLHIINVTSQKWLDETVSSRPIWWHFLCISIPDVIRRPDAGFIWVDGGDNENLALPQPTDNFVELASIFAVSTGSIGAAFFQIPNEHIVFKADPTQKQRGEDAIIAWTWKAFMENTSNPDILLRLPMTKAVIRALDTIQDFAQKQSKPVPKKFMVAGASKRGWTTWTTAAVDPKRVFMAVPVVMDILNMNTNMHNHFRSLGGWTFAFNDYYELNITSKVDTPEFLAMTEIVDPKSYLDRFTNTKLLVIVTGGDEFFLLDDTHAFWQDIVAATGGTILMRRLPNAEHSCAGHEISLFFTMRSFYMSVYDQQRLPSVTWTRPNNDTHGIIQVVVDKTLGPSPFDVRAYYAQTLDNKRKDFRLVIGDPNHPGKAIPHPVIWLNTKSVITTTETADKIIYQAVFLRKVSGWFGFFVQLSFAGPENTALEIATEANIIPETYPFPDCYRESCLGTLV